jgi:hypothetical protein
VNDDTDFIRELFAGSVFMFYGLIKFETSSTRKTVCQRYDADRLSGHTKSYNELHRKT